MKSIKKKLLAMAVVIGSLAITACGGDGAKSSKPKTKLPSYEVKIVGADGSEISTQTLEHGSKLSKPAEDPSAPAGQKFYGWMNVKNGGQVWNFDADDINVVMGDVELRPLFIPELEAQPFEAELCRDITEFAPDLDEDGNQKTDDLGNLKWKVMEGATYSGGASGSQLVNKRDKGHVLETSGNYTFEEDDYTVRYATAEDDPADCFGSFVHFMYKQNDTLTWKLQSDVAAENVVLMMRLSAEYGMTSTQTNEISLSFSDEDFLVTVNEQPVRYGNITIHNIIDMFWITFQDFYLSATVNLKAGENIIQMKVNNDRSLNGTIEATAPCVDCIKLFSKSTLTWPDAKLANLEF